MCLKVQLKMMTHDLSALKNGVKNKKFPLCDVWEVLMLVDSEAAAQVSGVAETVDYFG